MRRALIVSGLMAAAGLAAWFLTRGETRAPSSIPERTVSTTRSPSAPELREHEPQAEPPIVSQPPASTARRAGTIRGSIRSDEPLPRGAWVEALQVSLGADRPSARRAKLDRSPVEARSPAGLGYSLGSPDPPVTALAFELTDLAAGTYRLVAHFANETGRSVERGPITVSDGEVLEGVDLWFGRDGEIRGVIEPSQQSGGVRLELVRVDDQGRIVESRLQITAADFGTGKFCFGDVPDGRYAVVATSPSFAPSGRGGIEIPRDSARDGAEPVVIRMSAGGWIEGVVMDGASDRPADAAHVEATELETAMPLVAETDSAGRFRIRVPTGRFRIVATLEDDPSSGEASCAVADDTTESVVITTRRASR